MSEMKSTKPFPYLVAACLIAFMVWFVFWGSLPRTDPHLVETFNSVQEQVRDTP